VKNPAACIADLNAVGDTKDTTHQTPTHYPWIPWLNRGRILLFLLILFILQSGFLNEIKQNM